ncbi:MAG: tRNA (guanosine(46)-N7)-methyltransferase TrmB [Sulfuricaulis sp.]|nr:tRNA (guanosine(46)-N7)-methyltransferase TrmB [Sulfuricaulis sp.]
MSEPDKRRSIRSFVRREGRMTPAQTRSLKQLWPRYGIPQGDVPLDWPTVFGRAAPVILEIGFGNGEALVAVAAEHPENNYLGIEVHRPGAGSLLRMLEAGKLSNVRIMLADAKEVLAAQIPDASLTAVHLFFPDPWPKRRHHKRRLVQPDFSALTVRKLIPGGYFHLATDWQDYAEHMAAVLLRTPGLTDISGSVRFSALATSRRQTRFEQRGRRLGHVVRDLVFQRAD